MKKQFVLALFAFAAVSFASCTNDADLNGGKTPGLTEEKEGVGYMSFSFKSETRATTTDKAFSDGDPEEYKLAGTLNSHVAIFFDANGGYFGYSYLTPKNQITDGSGSHKGDADHNGNEDYKTTEKLYTYITRDPRVSKNGQNPTSVLVLLNARPANIEELLENLTNGYNLEKVKNELGSFDKFGIYKVDDTHSYYTMTNAVYLDNEEGISTLKLAVDVTGKVCASPEQAAANPVTIFVERVVAKHSLTFSQNGAKVSVGQLSGFITPGANSATDDYNTKFSYVAEFNNEDDTPKPVVYTWKAHIVGWGANALETNTFLYKRLQGTDNVNFNPNTSTDFDSWWNVPYFHRSYWAIDPNYNTGDNYSWDESCHGYPNQYRPTYDGSVLSWTDKSLYDPEGTEYQAKKWALDYVSYNSVKSTANNVYTLENTFAYEQALKNYAPLRYGTHVLVAAQLIFDNVDNVTYQKGFIDHVADKVYADGYFWSPEAYLHWAYKQVTEYVANGVAHTKVKDVFSTTNGVIAFAAAHPKALHTFYVKDGEEYKPLVYKESDGDGTAISDVFELAKAYIENGDGKVALTLKDNAEVYYRVVDEEVEPEEPGDEPVEPTEPEPVYVKLTKQQIASLTQTVMPAAAKYYNKGSMYYAVPVKHYSIYKEDFSGLGSAYYTGGESHDTEYTLGDFGTVRNHWYSFNISDIKKPGTPVDDPEDPIIPNEPEEYDYLGVEIVVLPWHVIEQDVEL
ncbi:MAG: Mfa1 fimbrilin C-terminal domain-containing protein [Alistipes sp.]|nr:Mfa1 fimbrilin C-terminal domain-containing protein [Alistipes sp.]